jgi:outer membrane protein assembly factor BamB
MSWRLRVILLSLAGAACLPAGRAQEWPRFRGPNGSGVGAAEVPARWTAADHAWKVKLPGVGHSSPVVWGKRIFLTSADVAKGERYLLCLHADDGRRLWARAYPCAKHGKHALNSFATATPAADAGHVYFSWGTPKEHVVLALDHDGKEVWRRDLGPFRAGHGFGASPLAHDGLVLVPNEQEGESSVVALDRRDGAVRWKAPREKEAGYSTPCIFRRPGGAEELVVTNWRQGVVGLDLRTGKKLWAAAVFDKGHIETAIGSPVVAGDLVLGVCGWLGVRQEVVAVRPGAGKAELVYALRRSAPLCTTPLVKGELLFLWSDEGVVTCADVRTGKVHWRERVEGKFYASPVCVGDRLYNASTDGEVFVLAAAKKYRQLGRNALGEGTHSTPAVAHGRLYLRTFTHLLALGGKK